MSKPKKRRDYSRLILKGILLLAVIYTISTFYDQYKEMEYLNAREQGLIQKIEAMERDIQELEDQIENSNTDEHIEKIAREHLKMIKEDELMFIDLGKSY